MATQITLTGGEQLTIRATVEELAAAIAGAAKAVGGGGDTIVVQLIADGRKLAEVVMPHWRTEQAKEDAAGASFGYTSRR